MIGPVQLIRLINIGTTAVKYGLTRHVISKNSVFLRLLTYLNPWSYSKKLHSRGDALRTILETLGPIFIKFGQVLSTRRDLIPDDIVNELARLQDQVKPFPGITAKKIVEQAFQKSTSEAFAAFDEAPLASASIAQVHAARLHDGSDVVVKVLRPDIKKTILHDIALMHFAARVFNRFWRKSKRLRPTELVSEFERTIIDEMDLNREAGNASQLRRNFDNSAIMYVPKIYWEYVTENVMVIERIYGVQISDISALKKAGTDMQKLAEYGVEIFFTQVLRDSFFHADMHPGNLFVDITNPKSPCYLGVDFGIMGTLSPEDQHYLAANLLAFFNRDYRQVAVLHIESGWVPADTRVDQFESAIRSVSEPIFEKPLKEISFGHLLLQLFRTAERFNMELQPQLMLLQKTLLSVEGLGRQLYPELDLWKTAKPLLERWATKRHSLKNLTQIAIRKIPEASEALLESPQIIYDIIKAIRAQQLIKKNYKHSQQSISSRRPFFLGAGFALISTAIITYLTSSLPTHTITPISNIAITCTVIGLIPRLNKPK